MNEIIILYFIVNFAFVAQSYAEKIHIKTFSYWARLPVPELVEKEARSQWKIGTTISHMIFISPIVLSTIVKHGWIVGALFFILILLCRASSMTLFLGIGTTSHIDRAINMIFDKTRICKNIKYRPAVFFTISNIAELALILIIKSIIS